MRYDPEIIEKSGGMAGFSTSPFDTSSYGGYVNYPYYIYNNPYTYYNPYNNPYYNPYYNPYNTYNPYIHYNPYNTYNTPRIHYSY
jgi:hypothetical protein